MSERHYRRGSGRSWWHRDVVVDYRLAAFLVGMYALLLAGLIWIAVH